MTEGDSAGVGAAESAVKLPTADDLQRLPKDERLMQAAQADKAAASATGLIDNLRSKAALLTNPKERERMLSEAFKHEVQARGLSKKARILKSGTFQGAAGGAGIGAATGVGLGTVVGTVVGTVASVPSTALGGLIGSGVGVAHGPFFKMPEIKSDGGEEKVTPTPQEDRDSGAVPVDDKTGQVTSEDAEASTKAVAAAEQATHVSASHEEQASEGVGERRKPPKLEIRSKKQSTKQPSTAVPNTPPRKKPPKLEIRSNKNKQTA